MSLNTKFGINPAEVHPTKEPKTKMFKRICALLLGIYLTFVFLLSGIIINFLQALLYLTLYNTNRSLYRKLNYYLIYTSWIQIVTVVEWWSNTSCNLYGDEESIRMFGKEHSIIIMNHKYDLDWVITWIICDKLGMLGNAKCCSKKSLRNIPVIGWGWVFAEMVFLERNWQKDKFTLGKQLQNLVEYEDPVMLLYLCEGTRFTPEKHQASVEFAKARNLPQLKHHLCPRTSGFNFTATYLKDKIPSMYDVQVAFPYGPVKPTFSNMLRGYSFAADMHIRRIPISEIPTDSDENTSKWLHQLYQEKDQLMDDYFKTQKFPGKCVQFKRSYISLLNSLFWAVVVGLPFLYTVIKIFTMGSIWVTSIAASIIIALLSSVFLMIRASNAAKGSAYGKDKSLPMSSNGAVSEDISVQEKEPNERLSESDDQHVETSTKSNKQHPENLLC